MKAILSVSSTHVFRIEKRAIVVVLGCPPELAEDVSLILKSAYVATTLVVLVILRNSTTCLPSLMGGKTDVKTPEQRRISQGDAVKSRSVHGPVPCGLSVPLSMKKAT